MPISLEKNPIATVLDSLDKLAAAVREEYEGRAYERELRDFDGTDYSVDAEGEAADRRALKKALQALAEALGHDDERG